MTIQEKAMLVILNISQWTGEKEDKKATKTVESTHKTNRGVGTYKKSLLPNSLELYRVKKLSSDMRKFIYNSTLPWHNHGTRIINNRAYLDLTKEFNNKKAKFDKAVQDFLSQYDKQRLEAQNKLGDLFNPLEYPSLDSLKEKFGCKLIFMPVQDAGDFRVEVSKEQKEALETAIKDAQKEAMQDAWERVYKVTKHAISKLSDDKAKFHKTLFSNIEDLCDLLPRLNISEDQNLEAIGNELKQAISKVTPDDCRNFEHKRQDTAKELEAIQNKMQAIMGGE